MGEDPPREPDHPPDSLADRADEACDRFENDWRAARGPRIEDFLESFIAPERPSLFRELLPLELELRREGGDQPEPREYLKRFPEYAELITTAFSQETFTTRRSGPDGSADSPAVSKPGRGGARKERGGPADDPLRRLPRTFGRYLAYQVLGQGGFGRVYLARDDELDRPVAIKVPNPERVAGPEDVEAYLAEARDPRQARPPAHRPGLRRRPHRRRPLLRRLEVHRGERPGGADAAGPAAVPGVGRAGGDGRRGAAPRPHAGAWSTATSSPPTS